MIQSTINRFKRFNDLRSKFGVFFAHSVICNASFPKLELEIYSKFKIV